MRLDLSFLKHLSVYFDDRLVIPVAVDLDVCTLQLDGRAVRLDEGFHLLANNN